MTRGELLPYVEEVVEVLRPACERIDIAGGIRREKSEPHDAEIVALPKWDEDLLGEPARASALLDGILRYAVGAGVLAWDQKTKRNGPLYKRFVLPRLDVPLDLFLAHPDNYGCILAIRTGDWEFARWFVTSRQFCGGMPYDLRHSDGRLWRFNGVNCPPTLIPCPTEEAFFDALGLPVLPPPERNTEGIRRLRAIQGASR